MPSGRKAKTFSDENGNEWIAHGKKKRKLLPLEELTKKLSEYQKQIPSTAIQVSKLPDSLYTQAKLRADTLFGFQSPTRLLHYLGFPVKEKTKFSLTEMIKIFQKALPRELVEQTLRSGSPLLIGPLLKKVPNGTSILNRLYVKKNKPFL